MRALSVIVVLIAILAMGLTAQTYRTVTVKEIQTVPQDSLLRADALQLQNPVRDWRLQVAPIFKQAVRETVEVVGQVVVPAKVITFTATGWTLLLRDTAADASWGGLLVRNGTTADSTLLQNNGFLNLERGDVIRIRGYIDEFPSNHPASYSQLVPIPSAPITVLEPGRAVPPPASVNVADFYWGLFPGGSIRFSTGEQYEGALVELTGLTVVSNLNATNGTVNLVDQDGNMISTMDASKYFSLRAHRDPASGYVIPPVNSIIDTIRGYISTNSGSEANRGFRITPIFPGDIVYGPVLPLIGTHRRDSVFVNIGVAPEVSVRAYPQTGSAPVRSVVRYYRVDGGAWQADSVLWAAAQGDSTFRFTIPAQPHGSRVDYWFKVYDANDRSITYASSAFGGAASDTSRGFFFYSVLNGSATIADIQYTPFTNGRSAYIGGTATVAGVVTADTSDIRLSSPAGGIYVQSSGLPWSGIWVVGVDSLLTAVKRGDSVLVTGSIQESNDVTRISLTAPMTVVASGKAMPAIPVVTSGGIGSQPNGAPAIEWYEGMVVRVNAVAITDSTPTFADLNEFAVDDGSGQLLVRRDGTNGYSTLSGDAVLGRTILTVGQNISSLTGIVSYSFNRYKLIPRGDADFGTITTSVESETDAIPAGYELAQNYPNPFNPTTTITFALPVSGAARLTVHNLLGQEVAVLVNQELSAGSHRVSFDGGSVPSGVYFYRLASGSTQLTKRMVLVK